MIEDGHWSGWAEGHNFFYGPTIYNKETTLFCFFMSLARYLYCVTPQNTTFELSCTLTCLSLMRSSLWSGYPLHSILLLHDSCQSGMSSLFFSKWLIPQQSLLSPLLYNYVFGHTGETAYEKSIKEWLRRFRRYFISPPLPKRKPMTRHDLW